MGTVHGVLEARIVEWFASPSPFLSKQINLSVLSHFICVQLSDPVDCSPPGSSVHGILQARRLEWSGLHAPPPGDLPNPGFEPKSLLSPALAGGFFTTGATWETHGTLT